MEGQDYTTCLLMSVVPDTNMEPAAGADSTEDDSVSNIYNDMFPPGAEVQDQEKSTEEARTGDDKDQKRGLKQNTGLDFSSPVVDAAFRPPEEKDKPMPASPGSPCGGRRAILVISVMFGVSFLVCLVFLSRAFINSVEDAKKDREKLKNLTDLQNVGLEDAKKDLEKMKKDLTDLQNVGLADAKKDREKMKKNLTDLQNVVTKDRADAKKERQQIQADLKTGLAALHNETVLTGLEDAKTDWEKMKKDLTDLQNVVATGLEDAKKDQEKMKKDLTDLQNVVTKDQADAKKERQQIQADLKTGLAALHNETDAICQACPTGWERFEQSCYFYSKTTQPWQTARDGCINLASHLAIITDSKEQTFLKTKHTAPLYWIGLSDQSKEGDWFWVDGSKPAFFSWSPGQPDNRGDEDCVVMEPTGLWHDYGCSYTTHWICEKTWTC